MLRPLFPFYGSKWRIAARYPASGPRVVEPFAGSAGYSLYHEPRQVALYDLDPVLVGVWDYLIRAPEAEVLALPDLGPGQTVDDLRLPQEARWLIGFWLNRGSAVPKKTQSSWSLRHGRPHLVWGPWARQRIASQLARVRHWTVAQASYEAVPAAPCTPTWFVDPPYATQGHRYRCRAVDRERLAAWCHALPGTVIVCEHPDAAWLPFAPLVNAKSTRGHAREGVCVLRNPDPEDF